MKTKIEENEKTVTVKIEAELSEFLTVASGGNSVILDIDIDSIDEFLYNLEEIKEELTIIKH